MKSNANLFSVWNISSRKTVLPLQIFRCSPDYRSTLMVQFCYLRLYLCIQTVFCRLLLRRTGGKDGHGLKIEKAGLTFSSFNIIPSKINKNIIMRVIAP